jgi:Domain of unknown function (DUF4160)
VPTVAAFDGIKIMFYNDEHPPPHFHAKYAEHEVMIEIETLSPIHGALPLPQQRSVIDWASGRRDALRAAWFSCGGGMPPGRIP